MDNWGSLGFLGSSTATPDQEPRVDIAGLGWPISLLLDTYLVSPDGVLGTQIFVFPYCPNMVRTALASSNHAKYITQTQQRVCLHSLRVLKPLISTFLRKNLQGTCWVICQMGSSLLCSFLGHPPHGLLPSMSLGLLITRACSLQCPSAAHNVCNYTYWNSAPLQLLFSSACSNLLVFPFCWVSVSMVPRYFPSLSKGTACLIPQIP